MLSFIAFIVVIGMCVLVHEFGHFITAKLFGVKVYEFAFGMGPKLCGKEFRGTVYAIRLFPLGGFVRLAGMGEEKEGESYAPGEGFSDKPPIQRFFILVSGSVFNILLALLIFAFYLMLVGVYNFDIAKVGAVFPNSPAEKAGLQVGDIILKVDDKNIKNWFDLSKTIAHQDKKELILTVKRDKQIIKIKVKPRFDKQLKRYLIGVSPSKVKYGLFEALYKSVAFTFKAGAEMIRSLIGALFRKTHLEVAGPLGIAVMAGKAASAGVWSLLFFVGALSLNLGIINLFPFPALDGGRIVFVLGEMIGVKIDPKRENIIHTVGLVLLIALVIYVTWGDISRFFIFKK